MTIMANILFVLFILAFSILAVLALNRILSHDDMMVVGLSALAGASIMRLIERIFNLGG